jgi:Lon protease-like protein
MRQGPQPRRPPWYLPAVREEAALLPIFPLPGVVLFPRVRTPLHIFEPRYRQMVEHALAGDRRIAMAVVRPDSVEEMAGDAAVFPTGCAGTIEQYRRRSDGRYDIVLHGTQRIRIESEPARPAETLFRSARVTLLDDPFRPEDVARVAAMRERVVELAIELFGDHAEGLSRDALAEIDSATFVNLLCCALPFPTPEKQALIEANGIADRFAALIDVLGFASLESQSRRVPNSRTFH